MAANQVVRNPSPLAMLEAPTNATNATKQVIGAQVCTPYTIPTRGRHR